MRKVCINYPRCGHQPCINIATMSEEIEEIISQTAMAVGKYCELYYVKTPKHDSVLSGHSWMHELLNGNENRFKEQMRMSKEVFYSMTDFMGHHCGLQPLGRLHLYESVGMFLKIAGYACSFNEVSERFQHSSETIHRHFHYMLHFMCTLGDIMIAPVVNNYEDVPQYVREDYRYYPYFDGCVGAIDGTHIILRMSDSTESSSFVNRHGQKSTNILAVCDFNYCIIFADVGKEGSMHDARLLMEAMRSSRRTFPFPPLGKYYLADSGFPQVLGFLPPYKDMRYHIPEFRQARRVRNADEKFNYFHSSLRSVVERTFGIIKGKWKILRSMSTFDLDTQIRLIWSCFGIHNYMRRHAAGVLDASIPELLRAAHTNVPNVINPDNPLMNDDETFGFAIVQGIRDDIRDSMQDLHIGAVGD